MEYENIPNPGTKPYLRHFPSIFDGTFGQFSKGMRELRSAVTNTLKQHGHQIFNLPGADFKTRSGRQAVTGIHASLADITLWNSASSSPTSNSQKALSGWGDSELDRKRKLLHEYLDNDFLVRVSPSVST